MPDATSIGANELVSQAVGGMVIGTAERFALASRLATSTAGEEAVQACLDSAFDTSGKINDWFYCEILDCLELCQDMLDAPLLGR